MPPPMPAVLQAPKPRLILPMQTDPPVTQVSTPRFLLDFLPTRSSSQLQRWHCQPLDSCQSRPRKVAFGPLNPFSLHSISVPTVQAPGPLLDQPLYGSSCLQSRSLHPASMPRSLKHQSHPVTSIFTMLSCLTFRLTSGLSMFWALFATFPPPSLPNVPRSHIKLFFAHGVPSKRPQISPLQGHLPCLSSVSPAPNASLHCNTYPAVMGPCEHGGLPPGRYGSLREGKVSSAILYSLSGT